MSEWICINDICIPSDENDWEELVAFADAIAGQEPIDIVRCGECSKRMTDDCPMCNMCHAGKVPTDADDFCSYGEREGE